MAENSQIGKPAVGFDRDIHYLLGLTFDAVDMDGAVRVVIDAVREKRKTFISTPNLNFLIASQKNETFRNSVINSDLSIADGMPIVFLCKMFGIPIKVRVAGSSLIETLGDNEECKNNPIKVFFFGGQDGMAAKAHANLNSSLNGLTSVGFLNPGFGSVEDMSEDSIIEEVNKAGADFIIVSLGAVKGQAWIERNRKNLNAPVISHLGAVVNFMAGSVKRAPEWVQTMHLEWLWRIKEEPSLFSRYFKDGVSLIHLIITQAVRQSMNLRSNKPNNVKHLVKPKIVIAGDPNVIFLEGVIIKDNLQEIRKLFKNIMLKKTSVTIDVSKVDYMDTVFMGLLTLLKRDLAQIKCGLTICGLQKNLPQSLLNEFQKEVAG